MRWWLVVVCLAACPGPAADQQQPYIEPMASPSRPRLDDSLIEFRFEGGQIEFEVWRQGSRVTQLARNRYAVPLVMRWAIPTFANLTPLTPTEGVIVLPAADKPSGTSQSLVLAEFEIIDTAYRYRREISYRAKFGDPRARPEDYAYRLPYPTGLTFSVLQGFHGTFSHRGSNEFAVDFDCPVATPVLATRDGVVIASNAAAQGAGTTSEYLDY
ncbi:MAG: hypothetical protein H0T65_05660, partial [Deltaproteobacteria bacterium]|nr:hypothetical protein [Deltaproteobacteria bacterium]